MREGAVLHILHTLFQVPLDIKDDVDLRQYIQDSIDVGEFAAEIKQQFKINLEVTDFQNITTLSQIKKLLEEKSSHES